MAYKTKQTSSWLVQLYYSQLAEPAPSCERGITLSNIDRSVVNFGKEGAENGIRWASGGIENGETASPWLPTFTNVLSLPRLALLSMTCISAATTYDLYPVYTIEQTSSKCIQNTRANCSTSARWLRAFIQLARRATVISMLIRRAGGL